MEWSLRVVPLGQIDTSDRASWTATKEPGRVAHFVATIQAGGKLKPLVLLQTPDAVYHLGDGHHRFVAEEQCGVDPLAYVGQVPTWDGPWKDMHAQQRSGPSRSETPDNLTPEERAWVDQDPSNADRPDNPPGFVQDEATWERAKAAVMPYWDKQDQPYAVVMTVYKAMGGATGSSKS